MISIDVLACILTSQVSVQWLCDDWLGISFQGLDSRHFLSFLLMVG